MSFDCTPNYAAYYPGSFTRVARNETTYEKILDAADFARRENCSFVRLNDAFRKTLLKVAKKL